MKYACALLCAAACGGEAMRTDPIDPFTRVHTVETIGPMRAMVATPAGVVMASERDGRIYLYEGEALTSSLAIGSGPRAVARFDVDRVATANGGDSTISIVRVAPHALTLSSSIALDATPFHVAALDGAILVTRGLDIGERAIEVWEEIDGRFVRNGEGVSVPGAIFTATGDLDGDGDADAVVLEPAASKAVFFRNEGAHRLTMRGELDVCADAYAARIFDRRVILACRSGGLDLLTNVEIGYGVSAARKHLDGGDNNYDVIAEDLNDDGAIDFAAVDLDGPHALVWLGLGGDAYALASPHNVDRGPIAIATAASADGKRELIVLCFEARAFDVLTMEDVK